MDFEITYILETNRFQIRHDGRLISGSLGVTPDRIAKCIQDFADVKLDT